METLLQYALTKPGTRKDTPFGPDIQVLKVASKMFALLFEHQGQPVINLKCDPFRADELRQQFPCIRPAYHMNKSHWNTITLDGSLSEEELHHMIDYSYKLVFRKLTRAEREEIERHDKYLRLTGQK